MNMVRRLPRRMVPPMWVVDPSGMNTTAGAGVARSNSVLLAFSRPRTCRAKSITITCIPKQMPRYGRPLSRAYLDARIFPSTPRSPNPPGTRMPSELLIAAHAASKPAASSSFAAGSSLEASIHTITSLRFTAMAACCSALMTLRYESVRPVYLPTIAIFTSSVRLSHFSARAPHPLRSMPLGALSLRRSMMTAAPPCASIMSGTCQMLDTSWRLRMWSVVTWQKSASFSRVDSSRWHVLRTARRSGARPRERKVMTECCVGFVFCSFDSPSTGTRDTWMRHMLSLPTRNWNWRSASTKGIDSMSPTVPPSSMMHTSGVPSLPSTAWWATRSIQSWIASVI
mmetsp:Transcript_55573/g.176451  ORF Transcript_55573/g.176451 Transcript_55573/m.176451 type:complete len:341 (-) Transcript_55573:447-1469(-)